MPTPPSPPPLRLPRPMLAVGDGQTQRRLLAQGEAVQSEAWFTPTGSWTQAPEFFVPNPTREGALFGLSFPADQRNGEQVEPPTAQALVSGTSPIGPVDEACPDHAADAMRSAVTQKGQGAPTSVPLTDAPETSETQHAVSI